MADLIVRLALGAFVTAPMLGTTPGHGKGCRYSSRSIPLLIVWAPCGGLGIGRRRAVVGSRTLLGMSRWAGSTKGIDTMRRYRRIGAMAAAGLMALGMTGCEPPPPRLRLTVNSTAAGADDAPGDGICSSASAGGACTLRAALEEGDAAPDGADITVPAGHYTITGATITGDVAINPGAPATVTITDTTITVAAGGQLVLSGVNTSRTIQAPPPSLDRPSTTPSLLRLEVAGTAVVDGSILARLDVADGGSAVVVDSIVESATTNRHQVLALRSSFFDDAANGSAGPVLTTSAAGASYLAGSVLAIPHQHVSLGFDFPGGQGTCSGPAPTSAPYMFVEVPCGPMVGEGEGSGDAGATVSYTVAYTGIGYRQVGATYDLKATSPLVDAIPVGHWACAPGSVDVYGQPRGVDGNGDGIPGCDIGAVERQP